MGPLNLQRTERAKKENAENGRGGTSSDDEKESRTTFQRSATENDPSGACIAWLVHMLSPTRALSIRLGERRDASRPSGAPRKEGNARLPVYSLYLKLVIFLTCSVR